MRNREKVVPPNIMTILEDASKYVGLYEAECFSQRVWSELADGDLASPIEFALHIGFRAIAVINYMQFAEPINEETMSTGLLICPQKVIGPYRADFYVCYYKHINKVNSIFREVAVECDGTAFHERTEEERRREKGRDRYMQKRGLKVFRYTGKEILDDPYKIAAEIIGYVTDDEKNTVTPAQYFA